MSDNLENKNIFIWNKDFNLFFTSTVLQKFEELSLKEKQKHMKLFNSSFSVIQDKFPINARTYLDNYRNENDNFYKIIKLAEEFTDELDFSQFCTILLALKTGKTWIGTGRNNHVETFTKIFQTVKSKGDFLNWLIKVIVDYQGFGLSSKGWISEINNINFNLNPKLSFSLLKETDNKKLSINWDIKV